MEIGVVTPLYKNMFKETQGYVKDLPEVMQPFYLDELRSEPLLDDNGEQVLQEEEYEYLDENGDTQTGVRMVPVFHDVNYVVEKPRYDLKSWDYVEKAKNYDAKMYGIHKACEAEQWAYHDEYVEWYFRPEPKRAQDENGQFIGDDPETPENEAWENGFTPEMYAAQPEPINTSTEPEPIIEELHQELAKQTRDEAVKENISMFGGEWQVRDKDMINVQDAIDEAEFLGLPPEATEPWILADNSIRPTTALELKQIKSARAQHKSSVFAAYAIWREGDKLTPFII
ncbi:protein of unknown function DUF4376 [Vibrio phage 1.238.B._10N.261.52.F10]|nr:protein of unknown function DUF4376 [Vibrio phage 1.238.B._10N.261.52.F10]